MTVALWAGVEEAALQAGTLSKPLKGLSDAAVVGMRMGTAHYAENAKHHAAAVAEAMGNGSPET